MHAGRLSIAFPRVLREQYFIAIARSTKMRLTGDPLATLGFCTVSLALVVIGLAIATSKRVENFLADARFFTCSFTHEGRYTQ